MAKEHARLKLGKRASFVKTHIKQLPRENESWEADFRALPKPAGQTDTHYLGLVVALPKGDSLVYLVVEYTPTVNDLADLLADAMRRPLTGSANRPEHIHFPDNPSWEELLRHLSDLGIATSIHDDFPEVEVVYLDFCRQIRKAGSGPIIMLLHRPTRVDQQFPAIGEWVQESGWIEVGRRKEAGFLARALDDNGLVFENNRSNTLAKAMAAMEKGLTEWFKEQGI